MCSSSDFVNTPKIDLLKLSYEKASNIKIQIWDWINFVCLLWISQQKYNWWCTKYRRTPLNKKKKYLKAKIDELEGISDFKKGYQPRTNIIKDEKGDLFTDSHSILARWKNHFSHILNVHSVKQKSISLIFRTSHSGSHVMYSCHHNSSRFTFPIFVHSWLQTDLAVTIQSLTLSWVEAESLYNTNTVIKLNPIESVWREVKRTMQETWPVLPPRNSDESGMKLLCLSVTFDHCLSPWHDEWNQWLKQMGSWFLTKAVNFWKQPF